MPFFSDNVQYIMMYIIMHVIMYVILCNDVLEPLQKIYDAFEHLSIEIS
jgi:Na+/proline symporter